MPSLIVLTVRCRHGGLTMASSMQPGSAALQRLRTVPHCILRMVETTLMCVASFFMPTTCRADSSPRWCQSGCLYLCI